MKRKTNKLLAVILSLVMLIGLLPTIGAFAAEIVDQGQCGENAYWTLDSEGTLTISGTGEIAENAFAMDEEDFGKSAGIKNLVIEDGITRIGYEAFYCCYFLNSVTMADSVTSIGFGAFSGCISLSDLKISEGVTSIESTAFAGCFSLKDVTIPENVEIMDIYSFYECQNLESITVKNPNTQLSTSAMGYAETKFGMPISEFISCSMRFIELETEIEDAAVAMELAIENIDEDVLDEAFEEVLQLIEENSPEKLEEFEESETLDEIVEIYKWILTEYSYVFEKYGVLDGFADYVSALENYANSITEREELQIKILSSIEISEPYKLENFTIYGYENSTAQAYANEHGLTFAVIGSEPPHEHSYTSAITTAATCTEAGVMTYTCTCGESYTEEIPAKGHSYGDWAVTKAPTCTEEGAQAKVCACGDTITEAISAKGHSYGDWSVTKAPTCTEDGTQAKVCACGDTITEAIPATNNHVDNNGDGKCDTCDKQLTEPSTPDNPGEDKPQDNSFFGKIKSFFQRIIDWFRNIFKR